MRVNERECRKPEWAPGAEVVLSDGQVWHFPRPRLLFRMHLSPAAGAPALKPDATRQSSTYAEMLDRLDAADDSATWFSLVTALALELLAQSYAIPEAAVPELFTVDPSSQVSIHRWRALAQAVKGIGTYPKV
jgi:hypothetical protein